MSTRSVGRFELSSVAFKADMELQKYHSIHAKGGTVDDIPNGAEM